MKLLRFFVKHSIRDMLRSRSRTAFALVCVATGVTAVVALRSLAFMVADELTTNLAEMNRGDVRIYASRDVPDIVEISPQGDPVFTHEAVAAFRDWASDEQVKITFARLSGVSSIRQIVPGDNISPKPILTFFVEPDIYPFYSQIILKEPPGVALADAFPDTVSEAGAVAGVLGAQLGSVAAEMATLGTPNILYTAYLAAHPRSVVISSDLLRQSSLALKVGDLVRIGASDVLYRVSGVAPASSESLLASPQTALLDYVYIPITDSLFLGEPALPDQVFVQAPLGRDIDALEKSLVRFLGTRFGSKTDYAKELNRASVLELQEQNAQTADVIDDMILVMGLTSLLIGGIGIINTMLVVVSRRTLEVAVLKTLGLKGSRITQLFLIEALLMGIIGSLIGIVVGVVLSYLIKDVGERTFQMALVWRLYPEAMMSGLFLGVVMTVLFGFLPTLIAGQVRPAVVLRPNEAQMPAAGLLQTLATLIVMIVVLGLLVDSIVEGIISISPVYMVAGGAALVGLFAGVITANTGVVQPIPSYYVFRLPRRFERLENAITGTIGAILLPFTKDRARGRQHLGRGAATLFLRMLRQTVLLYGSLAVGAALASAILLILSEIWLPSGLGTVKPAGNIISALDRGRWLWVVAWLGLTLGIGYGIRRLSQALVGVIALASLGVTFGAGAGWIAGLGLEAALVNTRIWDRLGELSTGVVLVEGALALLGAIFVGYWLLVWLVSRMPRWLLIALMSLALMLALGGLIYAVLLVGYAALLGLVIASIIVWVAVRRGTLTQFMTTGTLSYGEEHPKVARFAAQGASMVMVNVALLAGGLLLLDAGGSRFWWGGVIIGVFIFVRLWRYLWRRYRMDAHLILREMNGRRNRIASTLLGLSVGIAGLSIVSLTADAVSRLLEVQLGDQAEGNLLVIARQSEQRDAIKAILQQADGVEDYAQYTTYRSVLVEINGETVTPFHEQTISEEEDPRENSNFDVIETGAAAYLSEREDLNNLPNYDMISGRKFQPDDLGHPHVMVRQTFFSEHLGIKTGDRLMFLFENGPGSQDDVLIRFTVIGMIARQSEQTAFGDQFMIPPGALPGTISPMTTVTVIRVDESSDAYMDHLLIALSEVPGVLPIEISEITRLIQNLLDQLKAIPTLVAWLALFAGTAIIANTVALATQERRRQIGVMKAVGLKGWRVLGMLMVENGLVGFIAGLIGVAVGLLITVVLVLASNNPDQLKRVLDFSTIVWLIIMSIVVAIAASVLSAWSAAAEKPMNVLRYE